VLINLLILWLTGNLGAAWFSARQLKPERIAESAFTEWTQESRLRHTTFVGLRSDVRRRDVWREP
jgi:ATP-dependent DNA ligase